MTTPSGTAPYTAGDVVGGRYRVVRAVAQGGMGAVYEVADTRLSDRRCALKVLLDADLADRERDEVAAWFEREAQILSTLRHPLIPTVGDYFSDGRRHCLVMDFVDGITLEQLLERDGNPGLPLADVLGWAEQLCAVLHYLHGSRPPVIFRDLKPANIMRQDDGSLKLIDFGIARRLERTGSGHTVYTMVGTPGYSPPEQYQGLADPRSDIYSLGATLHHLISGRDPRLHQPFTFPSLHASHPAVNPAVDAAIARALSMQSDQRYASAEEFRLALVEAAPAPDPAALAVSAPPRLIVSPDGRGTHTSIRRAIKDAEPGTCIEVLPGQYAGPVVLQKPLDLVALGGHGDDVVVETVDAPCLIVSAETALVRGFTFHGRHSAQEQTNTQDPPQLTLAGRLEQMARSLRAAVTAFIGTIGDQLGNRPCHAVEIVHGHVILEECRITSESPWCVVAIHEPTANPQLTRCLVHGGHDVGVYVYGQARGRLHECTIRDSGTGIVVSEGSHVIVQDCVVEGMRDAGVQFYKKGRGVVEGCAISYNGGPGIDIDQSVGPIIRTCHINRNGGSAIRLGYGAGGTVEDCDLSDNRRGAWNTVIRLRVTERGNRH